MEQTNVCGELNTKMMPSFLSLPTLHDRELRLGYDAVSEGVRITCIACASASTGRRRIRLNLRWREDLWLVAL